MWLAGAGEWKGDKTEIAGVIPDDVSAAVSLECTLACIM